VPSKTSMILMRDMTLLGDPRRVTNETKLEHRRYADAISPEQGCQWTVRQRAAQGGPVMIRT
jgi:hypothetical protein